MSKHRKNPTPPPEVEAAATNAHKPCERCHGTGREPTALERWDGIKMGLLGYMWTPDQIENVKAQIQFDDILVGVWMLSVEVDRAGKRVTLDRWPSTMSKGPSQLT